MLFRVMHRSVLYAEPTLLMRTMSHSNGRKSSTLPHSPTTHSSNSVVPHTTIGVQALMAVHHDKAGFLRKRGQRERLMENLRLSKHVNWRQHFVVVADGCCYIFDDEVSKEPHHKFSLTGYNRVMRTSSERNQFCFMLEPKTKIHSKTHVFACSCDDDRKQWMQAFKGAMLEANQSELSTSKGNPSEDDFYLDVEKPLFETDDFDDTGRHHNLDGDDDGSGKESDTSSDYDYPDEDDHTRVNVSDKNPPRRSLPPIPGDGDKAPKSPPAGSAKPTAPPRAKNKPLDPRKRESATTSPKDRPPVPTERLPPKRLTEKDCLFDTGDRDAAINILREKKVPGTFLIRKSRQGDSKVLAVMTTEDVKEYKIFAENGQVSLDKKAFFKTIDDLLENYSKMPLPNRAQTLGRAFSSH